MTAYLPSLPRTWFENKYPGVSISQPESQAITQTAANIGITVCLWYSSTQLHFQLWTKSVLVYLLRLVCIGWLTSFGDSPLTHHKCAWDRKVSSRVPGKIWSCRLHTIKFTCNLRHLAWRAWWVWRRGRNPWRHTQRELPCTDKCNWGT